MEEEWYLREFDEEIRLPGSMAENGKGMDIRLDMEWTGSIYDSSWYFRPEMARFREADDPWYPMWLTPVKYYVGPAWYSREITVPDGWQGRRILLSLERVHTESILWVDGTECGSRNSLVAPHEYDLSDLLTPGNHRITLRIDNRIKEVNVGPDSHSITDHTQGNWNGVTGKMEIRAMPAAWIDQVQVYPEPGNESARVKIRLGNRSELPVSVDLLLSAKSINTINKHRVPPVGAEIMLLENEKKWIELTLPMGSRFNTWDEFNPALYDLRVRLTGRSRFKHEKTVQFGMREFSAEGTRFSINGRQVFLRGNVDCAAFPLTGYPPMDPESWQRIFRKLKAYGLNHVRFHSWCPPEAAFIAADRTGIYLQAEGPTWPNHGVSLGDGLPIDDYIYEETRAMEKHYGNHASWVMLASGNEPAGRNQAGYLGGFVNYWKERDPRRLYTGASVGSRWPDVPEAEFVVRSRPRGIPWKHHPPQSDFDHRRALFNEPRPYVAHESGQYCAFPDFSEIEKYNGVMRARNFELFREILEERDMGEMAGKFLKASGKLQALCYKHEIEAALRTPGLAGFQLLSLNDFPGQGTALVGVLNSMYGEKGYITADDFAGFCGPTVALARIPKFVYTSDEAFYTDLEISHFGPFPIGNTRLTWEIKNPADSIIGSGYFEIPVLRVDNNNPAGNIIYELSHIREAQKLKLEVRLEHPSIANDWDFWVYPSKLPEQDTAPIYHCDQFDEEAIEVLEAGGDVLLLGAGHIECGKDVRMHLTPVFWNTSWFQMRPPHVTGIYCDPEHPVFNSFPSSYHSDLQWWEIQHNQQVMQLDGFPDGFQPIIQPIDTWFLSRKLGLLFEARILNGRIMVCSIDLSTDPGRRPVARQLLYSIRQYMLSESFDPEARLDPGLIRGLFDPSDEGGYDSHTASSTEDLVPEQ
jgi:hypothetical protein